MNKLLLSFILFFTVLPIYLECGEVRMIYSGTYEEAEKLVKSHMDMRNLTKAGIKNYDAHKTKEDSRFRQDRYVCTSECSSLRRILKAYTSRTQKAEVKAERALRENNPNMSYAYLSAYFKDHAVYKILVSQVLDVVENQKDIYEPAYVAELKRNCLKSLHILDTNGQRVKRLEDQINHKEAAS